LRVALFCLSAVFLAAGVCMGERWVLQVQPSNRAAVLQQLQALGFIVKATGKGFLAVEQNPQSPVWVREAAQSANAADSALESLSALGRYTPPHGGSFKSVPPTRRLSHMRSWQGIWSHVPLSSCPLAERLSFFAFVSFLPTHPNISKLSLNCTHQTSFHVVK